MVPQRQRQSLVTSWGPDERRPGVCACGDAVGVGRRMPAAFCAGGCPAGAGGCPRLAIAAQTREQLLAASSAGGRVSTGCEADCAASAASEEGAGSDVREAGPGKPSAGGAAAPHGRVPEAYEKVEGAGAGASRDLLRSAASCDVGALSCGSTASLRSGSAGSGASHKSPIIESAKSCICSSCCSSANTAAPPAGLERGAPPRSAGVGAGSARGGGRTEGRPHAAAPNEAAPRLCPPSAGNAATPL
mmetsp:Transcript_51748/g.172702  ORF Transcript_51748/g.172702 Transcript_51748/m.172702 type:complete len:246 (-) Transcript_51748:686-1423(-)